MTSEDYNIIRQLFVRYLKDYNYFQSLSFAFRYVLYPYNRDEMKESPNACNGGYLTHLLSGEIHTISNYAIFNPYNKTFLNDFGVIYSFKNKELLENHKLFALIIFLRYLVKLKELYRRSGNSRNCVHLTNDIKKIIEDYVAESN